MNLPRCAARLAPLAAALTVAGCANVPNPFGGAATVSAAASGARRAAHRGRFMGDSGRVDAAS
jgi:hypothetical protein